MIRKSFQNLLAKAEKELWSLDLDSFLIALFLLFIPTQFGKHFWPSFSFVDGIRIDYLSPTLYFTDFLIVALIAHNLKNFRIAIRNLKIEKINFLLILLFVLFLISSVVFSPAPLLGIYYLTKIVEFFLLGVVLIVNRKKIVKLIPLILPYSLLFESILGILQYLNKGSLNGIFYFLGERTFNSQTPLIANASINGNLVLRPYATFPHPNVFGAFIVFSILIILACQDIRQIKMSKICLLSFVLSIPALVLTFSRSSISALIACLVIIVVYKISKNKPIKKYLLGIVAIIISAFTTSAYFRFLKLNDLSFIDRKDLLSASINMIKDKPLFGVGLNNFFPTLPNYFRGSENVFFIQPVHNVLILAVAQIGILPVLVILYFLINLYRKTNFWGRLLLFNLLTLSMFDHYFLTIQQGQIILTLSISMAIIISINARIKVSA